MSRIASEGLIVAYGVTEPTAGSDLSAIRTAARRVEDAGGRIVAYRLDGVKQFITNGGVADLYTILAMAPEGPSFFAVGKGARGLTPGRREEKHGIRSSNTTQVILDDVDVPAEDLIGLVEGQGLRQAQQVFGYTRLMVAAFGLGAGTAAMRLAIQYANERRQGGSLLIEKQGFTHRLLVPHTARLEAARSFIEETARRLDAGEGDLSTEGAIAKYFATEAGNAAADAAIQAHGGYGYTREYEVEKIRRDVRITTIYEGTSEIMLNTIGKDRWRATLQTQGGFYRALAADMEKLARANAGCGAGAVAAAARALSELLEAARVARLTRHQHVLFLLADALAHVEVAAAFARRAAAGEDAPLRAKARAFARMTAAAVRDHANATVAGTGAMSGPTLRAFEKRMGREDLDDACSCGVSDMDEVAAAMRTPS
jgi:alkylation response protein AidB-like acyl-CoA dehydrogenase